MSTSDPRFRLVRLMADGRFHSGQRLAEELGVSRSAVWKQLKALREGTGLSFDAVRGKGYRLGAPVELFQEPIIRQALRPERSALLKTIHIHDSIDSTNTWLMQQAAAGVAAPSVCLAERQTAGKGRQGRVWVSPYGANIYLSLHWRFDLAPAQVASLSLASGVAVVQALSRLGVGGVALKWPNDLLWRRHKLAGLLLELRGEASGPSDVIVGVGLNIRMPPAEGEAIDQPWSDLSAMGGEIPSRNHLAALLIEELLDAMELFADAGLAPFREAWDTHDLFRGEQVSLHMGERQLRGDYLGIDDSGAMRLGIDGTIRSFQAGEVSLTRRED